MNQGAVGQTWFDDFLFKSTGLERNITVFHTIKKVLKGTAIWPDILQKTHYPGKHRRSWAEQL
jgi:hypothetical protein